MKRNDWTKKAMKELELLTITKKLTAGEVALVEAVLADTRPSAAVDPALFVAHTVSNMLLSQAGFPAIYTTPGIRQ